MDGMPRVGVSVKFTDPWFYNGAGVVVALQHKPHQAVLVKVDEIDDPKNQRWVGREVWLLPGYLTVL